MAGIAKVTAFLFLIAFGLCFVYRYSIVFGPEAQYGCRLAIVVSAAAALAGILPVIGCIASGSLAVGVAAMLGAGTRLALTIVGFVFVGLTGRANGWFFLFGVIFYVAFLLIETLLAIKFIKKEDDSNL